MIYRGNVVLASSGGTPDPILPASHPIFQDEFIGPFSSWVTVSTTADGVFDTTSAIQAAINTVGNIGSSTKAVVYLPSGTYKITSSLIITGKQNIALIGQDPATTTIKWAGTTAGSEGMLQLNGVAYSKFQRITWDGSGIKYCIDQSWDGSSFGGKMFDTGNEYSDCVFKNCQIGISGGRAGAGFAESPIVRCKFLSCTTAGISLGNFNALDIWIWYCLFDTCATGVTNLLGAGNYRVYNCVFRGSTNSDMVVGNTGEFSIRNNYSSNSNQFFKTMFTGNPCTVIFQGNTIVDTILAQSILVQNEGPINFIDNVVRSRATVANPTNGVIAFNSYPNANIIYTGNTFTVASSVSGRTTPTQDSLFVDTGNTIVTRASLLSLAEPTLPSTPANMSRTIFEVAAGSSASTIQTAINSANTAGNKSVVHLAFGSYNISTTLNIPANTTLQLIGDMYGDIAPTKLTWTGTTGPVILVNGPSKFSARNFYINGNGVGGMLIANADQVGAQIMGSQVELRGSGINLYAKQLSNVNVVLYSSGVAQTTGSGIKVEGTGVAGNSRVTMYGGAESDNATSHIVTSGGNLHIRDVWYESISNNQYLTITGPSNFISEASHIANTTALTQPQIQLTSVTGNVSIIGARMTHDISASGTSTGGNLLIAVGVFDIPSFVSSTATGLTIKGVQNRKKALITDDFGSASVADIGTAPTTSYLNTMLTEVRAIDSSLSSTTASGITDVRLNSLWIYNSTNAIEVRST